MTRPRPAPRRGHSRLDRVNEALREVIADELELVDDPRLELVTITGVKVDPDLRHAVVWFSSLSSRIPSAEAANGLDRHRARLQGAVGRQLRLKRTPELAFKFDPAIAAGTRVETILRDLRSEVPVPPESEAPEPEAPEPEASERRDEGRREGPTWSDGAAPQSQPAPDDRRN